MYETPIYLNDKALSDLFVSIKKAQLPRRAVWCNLHSPQLKEHNRLSDYMGGSGFTPYQSFVAEATPFLKQWLGQNMVAMGDVLFFEAVCRDDGSVLLIAKNNLILASRWLKIVTLEEFEAFVTK